MRLWKLFFVILFSLLLLVTQVKTKASSKKMQLQAVIKKIKMKMKIFIYFSTKIANFSRSDIDMFMFVQGFTANNEKQINKS